MINSIRPLIDALKVARQKKKLSQRALGSKIGVPQGRLSKIENGNIDLQITSLLEIARALDMDVMLVPRHLSLAVKNLIKHVESQSKNNEAQRSLYSLDDENMNDEDENG